MTFSNISVITEDTYLKLRLVVDYQKGNPYPGIFLAILGRGPRALQIGKISIINRQIGNFFQMIQFYPAPVDRNRYNGLLIFPAIGREPGVLACIILNRAMKVGNRIASAHGSFSLGCLAMSSFDLVRK